MTGLTIIDGGLSTELERLGAKFDGVLWTGRTLLDDPSLVQQAHENFAASGAQILITASYQVSESGFAELGLSTDQANAALTESVAVAKRAAQATGAKVAASVGPYGATLHDGSEYRGDYGVDQEFLEQFHRPRLATLVAAEPDYLAVETIPSVLEAKALANVLSEFEIPKWVSFTAKSQSGCWVQLCGSIVGYRLDRAGPQPHRPSCYRLPKSRWGMGFVCRSVDWSNSAHSGRMAT
jgi:homocysteine S-methyltransferase